MFYGPSCLHMPTCCAVTCAMIAVAISNLVKTLGMTRPRLQGGGGPLNPHHIIMPIQQNNLSSGPSLL